jgi:hypothetical protein
MEQVIEEKELTPLEKKIAKLRAETEERLNKDIEELILSEKAIEAKLTLDKTIKDLISDYEKTYKTTYFVEIPKTTQPKQSKLSLEEKYKLVDAEMIDGNPKYKLSEDGKGIIGANGDKITSIIKFNDGEGNKQTLGVTTYYKYLKPNTTKEEMEMLFPKKNIVIDKLKDGTLTEEDKKILRVQ